MGTDPVEGLYEFFLMGLAWLREDNPDTLARRGISVFATYEQASPVFKSAKMLTAVSWDLMERVRDRSVVYEGDKHPPKRELRRLIAESDKHNVILVVPKAGLAPDKLFGAGGYSHAITDAGVAFAMNAAGQHAKIVDAKKFLRGWRTYKSRLASYNAKQGKAARGSSGNATPESSQGIYIPPAPYSENDFDW